MQLLPEGEVRNFGFVRDSGLMDGILVGECRNQEAVQTVVRRTEPRKGSL